MSWLFFFSPLKRRIQLEVIKKEDNPKILKLSDTEQILQLISALKSTGYRLKKKDKFDFIYWRWTSGSKREGLSGELSPK